MKNCSKLPQSAREDKGFDTLTSVQTHLQTFYLNFVGIFGTPELFRCLDRKANKEEGKRQAKNRWINQYFPDGSLPIRMDMVHLEADKMDDLGKARFKLSLPADIMEELKISDLSLASFARIEQIGKCLTFKVLGHVSLIELYSSLVSWINIQLKSVRRLKKADSEYVANLIHYFYGLERAPVPQPLHKPAGKKRFNVSFPGVIRNKRKHGIGIRLLQ